MTSTRTCDSSSTRRIALPLFFVALVCSWAISASAVPVISTNTVGNSLLTGVAGSANFNFSHTTNSGGARMLLVGISMNVSNNTTSTIASVSYGGNALTLVNGATNSTRRVEFWRLINPPTGANSVVVTANVTTGTKVGVVASATTFFGVDQTTPNRAPVFNNGNNTGATVNTASGVGELVVDQVAALGGVTFAVGGGQTQYAYGSSGTGPTDGAGSSSWEAGAATVTMSDTLSASGRWEIGAISIRPTTTIADLVTTVSTLSPDPVALNATTSTTFTITNNGTLAATGATFTITLPGIVSSPVATPSTGSCSGTGPITCTFPSIANGGNVTVALTVTATTAGVISITGTANDTVEFDPPANSSATVTAKAQSPCGTPGNDGAGGTLTGVVNAYYPGTSTGVGTITVGVGNAAGANTNITAGDLLLVIQMQDAAITSTNNANYGSNTGVGTGYTSLNSAGQYEFVVATSGITFGTGGTFNFNGGGPGGGLINTYTNAAAAGVNGAKRFQVVRVPQYTSATLSSTLTAAAWNGTSGGILALDVAGVLTASGTVSVDAKGFRGGGGRALNGGGTGAATDYVKLASINANGGKGEGIAGTPQYVYNGALLNTTLEGLPNGSMARGAPGNAGGGGTDANQPANDENSGGGGGGNGGAGGQGGNSWNANAANGGIGGVALPTGQSRLFLGGGGGAGTSNNGSSDPNTNTTGLNSSGAIGGGLVFIRASEITGTGTITANGANALNVAQDGGGGGGAGGTIVVVTKAGVLTGLTLNATGGDGGSTWLAQAAGTCPNSVPIGAACNYHGPGGGGGGGVILTSSAVGITDVSGGANGLTTQGLVAFNSTAGAAGVTSNTAVFNAIPGTDSGAECAPDLSSTKTGNGPWIRGNTFSYTLSVSNLGIQDTVGVVTLTDTLPIGMVPTTASGSGWTCSVASQTVGCNRSDVLTGGQSYPSVTINGTVGQITADAISNTGTASGGGEMYAGNDSATNSSTASSVADLFVTSVDSPDPVAPGGSVTYTQTVSNNGPSYAGNATFSTTVPANTGFQSIAIPSGWSCTVPPIGASGTVTCVTNFLPAGASATFVMVTTLNAGVTSGVLVNLAAASSIAADPNLINNLELTATTVGASPADVTLTNLSSPTATTAGSNITFTQVVRNQGGSAATTVAFSEPIPANTTFQSFVNPGWSCSTPSVGGTGTITCSIASLAGGATATFTTVVKVNGATPQGTVISDTTTVGAANDSLATNNSATATSVVTLGTQSDLAVSSVASTPQVFAGNNVSFIQAIANNGPAAATTVTVNETVPAGTTFASVTPPPGWSCTAPVAGAFTCSTSSLAVGAVATIMLEVTVPSTTANNTTITDTVSASSSNGDPNSANNTSSASTTAITGANLVVTNTLGSGNDPAAVGGTYTLAQTVTNLGPSDSGVITLVETIPANVTVGVITKPVGWACGAQVGTTITCTGPNLAAGAAALNFAVPLTVNAGTPASTLLAETVSAQPAVSEKIPDDNSATYTNSVGIGTQADLAITATSTPVPVVAGQNLTYNATITNKGPATASTITFSLPVPANTTFVSFTAPIGCVTPPVGGTGTVTCTSASFPNGTSAAIQMVVKVNASAVDGSIITTTGTVGAATSDPNSSNNAATTTVPVLRESDLSITNTDSPDPLNTSVSNVVTYTQVITNNGPSDAANIVVTETVPTGTTFGSVTSKPAGWNCTAPSGGVFTCTGPSLAAGANGTIIFTVTNSTTGKLTQIASVSSDSLELNAVDNTASAITTIATGTQSDLQMAVTANVGTFSAGGNVAFTAVVTNRGPAVAANVTVTLPIPPNSTFVSLTFPGGWSCPLPAVGSTGTITCTIASLAVGATPNFVLTVKGDVSITPNTVIGETASVALAIPSNDPDLTNNSATASSRATNPTNADLAVTLVANPTSVKTGNSFTLTSVVSNAGPATATGTTLIVPITSEEQFVSVSTTQGSCVFTGGSVVCNLGSMPSAGSATITIVANAIAIGITTNTATAFSNETDPTPANAIANVGLVFSSPTSVRLVSFTATSDGSGVELDWRTREEVRNLGFNVYREVNGERVKLNGSLIAGSAVRTRLGLAQHSASTYKWIDEKPVNGATYVVEDVSVTGVRTWNGPVAAQRTAGLRKMGSSSSTLADISRTPKYTTIPFNPMPIVGTETTANSIPGWLTDTSNPSRPGRVQSPAKVESAWLAGRAAAKIAVDHMGWYRVTEAELTAAGFSPAGDPAMLHLFAEGFDVPIRMNTSANGLSFEFYGTGIDTPSTGTRIYWLTAGTGYGRRIPVTKPDNTLPGESNYLATVEKRDRSFYFAALTNNGEQDNFFGDVIAGAPVEQHLTVSNIDSNGRSTVTLFVELQGITDLAAHDVQVSVNGIGVGNVTFTGMLNRSLKVDVPIGNIVEGDNVVTLTPLAGDDDVTAVDRISITYPRIFTAVQDQLKFTVPGHTTINLNGFSSAARVFQLDTASLITTAFTQQQDGTYTGVLTNPDATPRTYYAFTEGMVQPAGAVTRNNVAQLSSASNAADLLIVSHESFIPSLAPLVTARQQQGYSTAVVNVEDVYDEFNYGESSPDALRKLLTTATANWHKVPKWLLLVGDASVDPRDFLGQGSFDFVPTKLIATTQMKTASDGWFADFQDTGVPQIATGRLTVRTVAEADAVVAKIVGYDQQALGTWNTQALLVTDENIGSDFSGETDTIASMLPTYLQPTVLNFANGDPGTVRAQLLAQLNAGQLLVNYLGHGSVDVWAGSGMLNSDDPVTLTNGGRLPFVVAMDCLNGFFHDVYQTSLAEALLLAPNGGAAAVWASSGLTEPESQFVMDQNLVQYLFANPSITIGEATTQAKTGVADADVRRTWNLFGDPTMKLRAGSN